MSEMSAAKLPQPFSPIEGLDESLKGLKDELQCPLCLDFYRDPLVLPCQHSFCRECVAGLVRPQGRDGSHGELECPLCRKNVHLDGTGVVECLPRNFHLGEIVEKFHAVETRLDVIRTEQLAKHQLQKHASETDQQQPHALHHQKQHEEPTGENGQTQNPHQMEQLQQHLGQIELRQSRFHQVDGLHSTKDNKPIRDNCAQPANIREHQGHQHRRQAGLGQQQLPSEVSQPGGLVPTLQEHIHDSFRQIREERHNQQRVLHQQLGQQHEEQQGNLQKLHQQLHQQRQQQQNQQQKLHQQLGKQREDLRGNLQKLHQQLHQQRQQQQNQQQKLRQQLGQQREGQKRHLQQLQHSLHQQRQQQRNQQQMQHQHHQGQMQLQQQQQQQGQRRAQQQQREHYHL